MAIPQADAAFEYRIPVTGLKLQSTGTTPPAQTPSPVGNGVSKAGACTPAVGNVGCEPAAAMTPRYSFETYLASKGKAEGKWYWEAKILKASTIPGMFGIATGPIPSYWYIGVPAGSMSYFAFNGALIMNGGNPVDGEANTAHVSREGDTIGIALDQDAKTLTIYRNCILLITHSLPNTTAAQRPAYSGYGPAQLSSGTPDTVSFNFGTVDFDCAVPAGFNAGIW